MSTAAEAGRPNTTRVHIEAWVCPTVGCGDYYASKAVEGVDLSQEMNTSVDGSRTTHSRARCPRCSRPGLDVDRQRVATTVYVPVPEEG